jgi:hypothetical protein
VPLVLSSLPPSQIICVSFKKVVQFQQQTLSYTQVGCDLGTLTGIIHFVVVVVIFRHQGSRCVTLERIFGVVDIEGVVT